MNKFSLLALKFGEAGLYDWLQTLKIKETSRIPTLCVRRGQMRVNPNFWAQLKEPERLGVLLHEVLHLAFEHDSLDLPNHKLANIAEDIVINETLISAGYTLPPGGQCREFYGIPSTLRTSREIYKFLEENGFGESSNGGNNNSNEGENNSDDEENSNSSDKSSDTKNSDLDSGSEKDNEPREESGKENPIIKEIINEIAEGICEKARVKKTVLQLPTVFPWEQILLSEVGRLIRRNQEGSYSRPARFRSSDKILRKGLRSTKSCPKVNFYIDCSGSMESCLATVAGKILAIKSRLKDFSPTYWGFADNGPFKMDFDNLECGGGTKFDKFVEDADLQIIITDGEFDFNFLESYKKRFILVTDGEVSLHNNKGTVIKVDFEKM